MAIPSEGKKLSAQKRAAIMAAAVDTFAKCGFDQASMDAIADAAQVSKRTVYNHFSSKDVLFDAIVQDLKQSSRRAGTLTFHPERPLEEQLSDFGQRVVDFHCHTESRKLARVILPRLLQSPQLAKELFGEARLFEQDLQAWLQAAVASQRLQKANVTTAARQFLGLLETFAVWPQVIKNAPSPTVAERRRIVAETVAMFLSRYQRDPR